MELYTLIAVSITLALALLGQTLRLARSIRQAREYRAGWVRAVIDFDNDLKEIRGVTDATG